MVASGARSGPLRLTWMGMLAESEDHKAGADDSEEVLQTDASASFCTQAGSLRACARIASGGT
eukprot:1172121-Rhodomonas_salina.1